MAKAIVMPQRGLSEESSIISKFYKSKGDTVKAGEAIFSIETDKTTFDVESDEDGVLLEVFYGEDDEVPVLTTVCIVGKPGENISDLIPKGNASEAQPVVKAEPAQVKEEAIIEAPAATGTVNTEGRIKISPRAKHLAEKSGVVVGCASPTGPEGRIIERDIVSLIENGPVVTSAAKDGYAAMSGAQVIGTGIGGRITTADLNKAAVTPEAPAVQAAVSNAADYVEVKLSGIRKAIAKNMFNSLSTTAQLTLHASFDATDILAYRKTIKANKERLGLEDISINDIIIYTVARTLLNHKDLNAHYFDDKMLIFNNASIGMAVDTERGLMVPTVANASLKSLNEIAKDTKSLAADCKKGSISPDKLKGASFTISNLGTFDVEGFTPVLNPPQTGILGVGSIVYRTKPVGDEFVNYPSIALSLTFDHRAIDGAPAARFLKELKTNLENFSILLAK